MLNLSNLNNISSLGEKTAFPWYKRNSLKLNGILPSFVHNYVNNTYYSTSSGSTGFPFTTIRTSNATTIDKQGRVSWAPHNLCTRGQDLATTWSMGSDGTVVLSGNTAPSGAPSYLTTWTTPTPSSGNAVTAQPVVIGADMTLSIYLRYVNNKWTRVGIYSNNNAANQVRAWVDLETKTLGTVSAGGTASNARATLTDEGDGWVRLSLSGLNTWFNTGDGGLLFATTDANGSTTRVGNGATIEAASAIFEMTGVQSPQVWDSTFNTAGSAKYFKRVEYDWQTGIIRGLRVEPGQTNIIATSASANAAGYISTNASMSDAPDIWGFKSILVTSVGGSLQNYVYVNGSGLSATAGSSYSVSAFVKKDTARYVQLTTSANYNVPSTSAPYINYDFDTDTIASGGTNLIASSAFREILADGWVRIGISFTANATATGSSCILAVINSLASTRLDATTSTGAVYTFGHQTESQGQVTSYIPTFATSATRAADITTIASIPWFNQTDGTIYVKAVPSQSDSVNTRRIVNFNDGTSSNRIELSRSGTQRVQNVVSTGGVSTFNPNSTTGTTDYVMFKAIGTYSPSIRRICLNGDTITSNVTPGPGAGITQAIIGSTVGFPNANTFGGWIQEVIYWPSSSASDAQLQAITA